METVTFSSPASTQTFQRRPVDASTTEDSLHSFVELSPALAVHLPEIFRAATTRGNVVATGEYGTGKRACIEALIELSSRGRHDAKIDFRSSPRHFHETALRAACRSDASPDAVATIFLEHIEHAARPCRNMIADIIERRDPSIRLLATHEPTADERPEDWRGTFAHRIVLSPLRERYREVGSLAQAMLGRHCAVLGRPAIWLDDATAKLLATRPWPGNLRELSNAMQAAALLERRSTLTMDTLQTCLG